jgi:hypothetical protein
MSSMVNTVTSTNLVDDGTRFVSEMFNLLLTPGAWGLGLFTFKFPLYNAFRGVSVLSRRRLGTRRAAAACSVPCPAEYSTVHQGKSPASNHFRLT